MLLSVFSYGTDMLDMTDIPMTSSISAPPLVQVETSVSDIAPNTVPTTSVSSTPLSGMALTAHFAVIVPEVRVPAENPAINPILSSHSQDDAEKFGKRTS